MRTSRIIFLLIVGLTLWACTTSDQQYIENVAKTVQDIAEAVANNALPANPEIYKTTALHIWPNDSNYYSSGTQFTLWVKKGVANQVTLSENGAPIPLQNYNDPNDIYHTTF